MTLVAATGSGAREHRRGGFLGGRRDGQAGREPREVGVHVSRALVPLLGVLRERPQDDRIELVGDLRALRRGRFGHGREMLHRHFQRRVARERDAAGQHLVEDDPGGVDVRRRPRRRAARLLGRQVLGGADDRAGLGHLAGA